jgi:histidyl-tRNA synthetase
MKKFQAPKGVSEFYPPSSTDFELLVETLLLPAKRAGYLPIELPIFEDTELFTRGVGGSTDVVTKEMYTFEDRAGRSLTLRPEGTAGVMRSVIEHGLDRGQLPIKLYYHGPFFRAERPQAGRYRQFFQVGVEAIGVTDPALDCEVIALADTAFRELGLKRYVLKITSLGDNESRARHRLDLTKFVEKLDLDEETKARFEKNPLRLFDDKRSEIVAAMQSAPLLLDYLSDDSRDEFAQVQSYLTSLGIDYEIEPKMVRGLDYYTGTTFEFVHQDLGAQSGIGGGGRYDGLMAELGGAELSGIGFGLGVDRILLALASENLTLDQSQSKLDLYLIPLTASAKEKSIRVMNELRSSGYRVDMSYGERGLKGSMKSADKLGVRFSAVIGDDEIESGVISLKNMVSGENLSVKLGAEAIASSLKRLTI